MLAPVTPYGPEAESQFQPLIATSHIDCVPNTTRKMIRRSTADAKAPTTKAIRAATGITTRGLSYGEAAEAAWETAKVKLVPSYANTREEMVDLVDGGHSVGISIDCSETVNTPRATNSYTGDHTIYCHDLRHVEVGETCLGGAVPTKATKAHNEYLNEDPGNSSKAYEWWDASLVYKAAEARTTDKNGISHGINLLVGPDTEGVTWTARAVADIRSEPSYSTGRRIGRTVAGRSYKGGRTQTGGKWKRADGTTYGKGWVHIEVNGVWGWRKGRDMEIAA